MIQCHGCCFFLVLIVRYTKVHYQRSVKRISERLNKNAKNGAHQAFTSIGYAIPNVTKKEHVEILFKVLCGSSPLSSAIKILPKLTVLSESESEHNPDNWNACSHWVAWWMRKNHLSKHHALT